MRSRRSLYVAWLGVLLFCSTPLAIAQNHDIQYPFLTTSVPSSYGLYFVLPAVDVDRGVSLSQLSNLAYYPIDRWVANGVNSYRSKEFFLGAVLKYLYQNNALVGYNSLSDYGSYSGDYIIAQFPRNIDVVSIPQYSGDVDFALLMAIDAVLVVRSVNSDSDTSINSATSPPTEFDVFFYARLRGPFISGQYFNSGILRRNTSTQALSFDTNAISVVDTDFTYQLCASFRVDANGDFVDFDINRFGIPFSYDGDSTIYFCRGSSGYWSFGSATTYGDSNWFFQFPDSRSLARQFYTPLTIQTVNNYLVFNGLSTDPAPTNFSTLDSDRGSMTDFHEWYQTRHNLLNPADDRTDTTTIEPYEPPEPDEGTEVVDIGKDTFDRYEYIMQETVGDTFELPNIEPSQISDPDSFEIPEFNINSLASSAESAASSELQQYQGRLDELFGALNSGDVSPDLTFRPTLDFSTVDTVVTLDTVDLNPVNILGFNSRALTGYRQAFAPFRAILVIAQFLVFVWFCIKLILNTCAPGSPDGGKDD